MIALPFNDLRCLGSITEVITELVDNEDTAIEDSAAKQKTSPLLVRVMDTRVRPSRNGRRRTWDTSASNSRQTPDPAVALTSI